MKIVDFIGNTIQKGQKLYWKDTQLFVDIAEVVPPTEDQPGAVVLSIVLPIPFDKHKPIAQMSPFIRVVDPNSEILVAKMAGGK